MKQYYINKIQEKISKYGVITIADLMADHSVLYQWLGPVCGLIEAYYNDYCEVVLYHRDNELDSINVPYREFSLKTLKEIWKEIEDYDGDE